MRFDHGVGAGLAEAQRNGVAVFGLPVHHRPLVQPETAETWLPAGDRLAECAYLPGHVPAVGQERGRIHRHRPVGIGAVPALVGILVGVVECDADARMPLAQHRGTVRVVGEQEVVDGVAAPRGACAAILGRKRICPVRVFGCELLPPGRGKSLRHDAASLVVVRAWLFAVCLPADFCFLASDFCFLKSDFWLQNREFGSGLRRNIRFCSQETNFCIRMQSGNNSQFWDAARKQNSATGCSQETKI